MSVNGIPSSFARTRDRRSGDDNRAEVPTSTRVDEGIAALAMSAITAGRRRNDRVVRSAWIDEF